MTVVDMEKEAISRLNSYLDILKRFEKPLIALLRKKYPPEEVMEAEGKKCIIRVSGLKTHDLIIFFEVTGMSITRVEPFEKYDTYVQVPIWTLNKFLAGVLSGDEDAFGDIVAGGEVKFMGQKTYHDLLIFNDCLKTLARNIGRLRRI